MNKIIKTSLIILISVILMIAFIPTKPVSAYSAIPESGGVYLIRNIDTGKYLNVNFGKDANGTNVNQWAKDGSIDQKWRYVENGDGTFKLYAMCSSNGTNRVLDALRTGGSASGSIKSGNNVDIWAPNDPTAQNWVLENTERGFFQIFLASNSNLHLVSYGTGNGSGAGTSATSNGNVRLYEFGTEPNNDTNIYSGWEFVEV